MHVDVACMDMYIVTSCSWRADISSCFYPNMSGEEVETILKSVEKHGSFLFWLHNGQNGYWHYIISVV